MHTSRFVSKYVKLHKATADSVFSVYFFRTPTYSSTVFVEMVVVVFVVSFCSTHVAVVLIVRHALQLVIAIIAHRTTRPIKMFRFIIPSLDNSLNPSFVHSLIFKFV